MGGFGFGIHRAERRRFVAVLRVPAQCAGHLAAQGFKPVEGFGFQSGFQLPDLFWGERLALVLPFSQFFRQLVQRIIRIQSQTVVNGFVGQPGSHELVSDVSVIDALIGYVERTRSPAHNSAGQSASGTCPRHLADTFEKRFLLRLRFTQALFLIRLDGNGKVRTFSHNG